MLKLASPKVMVLLAVMALLFSQSVSADQINEDSEDNEEEAENEFSFEFTLDALSDFRVCLCEGTSHECRAIIKGEDSGLTVTDIQRNGSFSGGKQPCKFYVCEIKEDFSELVCDQVDKDFACGLNHSSQPLAAHDFCCDPVCQRLYWPNPEDMIPFTSTETDKNKCESMCSCPTETTTEPPLLQTNTTTSSTGSINITNSSTFTTEIVTLINITEAVTKTTSSSTTTTDDSANIHSNVTAQKSISDSEDSNTIVIATVFGAIVFVGVVVVLFCLKKRLHNRTNSPSGENGDANNTVIAMGKFDRSDGSTYSSAVADSTTNRRMIDENNENGVKSSSETNNSSPAENSTNTTPSTSTLTHSNQPKIASSYIKLSENGSGSEPEQGSLDTNSQTQPTDKLLQTEHPTTPVENEDTDSSVPLLKPSESTHY